MELFSKVKLVDLTHTVDENIPTWTGECGFRSSILVDYPEVARVLEYHCIGSAGTHIDAPSHFIPNGRDVDQLTLEELCIEVCVVDMTESLHPAAQISIEDFEHYEKVYGEIPKKVSYWEIRVGAVIGKHPKSIGAKERVPCARRYRLELATC